MTMRMTEIAKSKFGYKASYVCPEVFLRAIALNLDCVVVDRKFCFTLSFSTVMLKWVKTTPGNPRKILR